MDINSEVPGYPWEMGCCTIVCCSEPKTVKRPRWSRVDLVLKLRLKN